MCVPKLTLEASDFLGFFGSIVTGANRGDIPIEITILRKPTTESTEADAKIFGAF